MISVKFNEGEGQDSYDGIYVYSEDINDPKIFFSDNFVKDFNDAIEWYTRNIESNVIMMSSTVDFFLEESPQRYMIDSHGMGYNDGNPNG